MLKEKQNDWNWNSKWYENIDSQFGFAFQFLFAFTYRLEPCELTINEVIKVKKVIKIYIWELIFYIQCIKMYKRLLISIFFTLFSINCKKYLVEIHDQASPPKQYHSGGTGLYFCASLKKFLKIQIWLKKFQKQ